MTFWEENADRVASGQVFSTEDGRLVTLIEQKDYCTWEVDQWNGLYWAMCDAQTLRPFSIGLSELRDKMPDGYYPAFSTPRLTTAQSEVDNE